MLNSLKVIGAVSKLTSNSTLLQKYLIEYYSVVAKSLVTVTEVIGSKHFKRFMDNNQENVDQLLAACHTIWDTAIKLADDPDLKAMGSMLIEKQELVDTSQLTNCCAELSQIIEDELSDDE